MFKNILVPLDGSALSERALGPALAIGQQDGATVTLVRTPVAEVAIVPTVELFGNFSLRGLDEATAAAGREAASYLRQLERALARPAVTIRSEVVDGDPAQAILTTAEARHADLIVMSTHGYSGVTRWIMGSVTERVLAHARCPVLVIRSEAPLNKMLIPLDGSALSETALGPGLEVASALDAGVTLFRAVRNVPGYYIEELEQVERGLGLRLQSELSGEAEAYLRGLTETQAGRRTSVDIAVRSGAAADAILNYAEAAGVDVVAMATHGRTGAQRWVYGSVTEKILRNSQGFAMLVIRPRRPASTGSR
jgi:nucleotide-binding universal stress UspA family protein